MVEFPGVVKNADKAMEMLGGTSAVSSVNFCFRPCVKFLVLGTFFFRAAKVKI